MLEKPKRLNVPQPKQIAKIRVGVVGDPITGKTQIINRYVNDAYDSLYASTLAVDQNSKMVQDTQINFIDFSGSPDFIEVRNEFYRDCNYILLVYDVSEEKTFHSLDKWMDELKENQHDAVKYLIGNKIDTPFRMVSEKQGQIWANQNKFNFIEVSAKDNKNINQLFNELIQKFK